MRVVEQDRRARRFEQIIGSSPALKVVLEQVERVAGADTTVLIHGETGTGKELIAHAIHNASPRSGKPLIKLNCAAIPFDLLESESSAMSGGLSQVPLRKKLADSNWPIKGLYSLMRSETYHSHYNPNSSVFYRSRNLSA